MKRLRQAIVNLVVPGGVIEEPHEDRDYVTTTTHMLTPEQLEMIAKLAEAGIGTVISTWPAGIRHPNLKDKSMKGRLVLRFEWSS